MNMIDNPTLYLDTNWNRAFIAWLVHVLHLNMDHMIFVAFYLSLSSIITLNVILQFHCIIKLNGN